MFARAVCWRAPYFASISPRIALLEPGRCEAWIAHRRKVTNHIGTVHAIALCNLAELAGGLMTDVSIPSSMRWIPKGMQVEYLGKANGTMHAVATLDIPAVESATGYELPVTVVVTDLDPSPTRLQTLRQADPTVFVIGEEHAHDAGYDLLRRLRRDARLRWASPSFLFAISRAPFSYRACGCPSRCACRTAR